MGKARILSAQGEGRYTIEILEDRTRAESLKTLAEQRISQIDSELGDLEQDLAAAQQGVDAAAAAQDQAVADYQQAIADGEQPSQQSLTEAAQDVIEAAQQRDAVRTQIAALNLERLTRQTYIDRVDALPAPRQVEAWCADHTEDLSGEVATAEVPGEIGQVIIKPGYGGANQWSASADGAIQPALASTPAGVFYNLAMMPGWQKWRPTFRIATISNIDNDLCNISLDTATSSQQGLNVNAQSSYSGVPIIYMNCNGGAFKDGDKVLVAFSGNTGQPMVVGFAERPRTCRSGILAIPAFDEISPEDAILRDGASFYSQFRSKIDSKEYAVSVIDIPNDSGRFNYIPSWAISVTELSYYQLRAQDFISAYEKAVEARSGREFEKVIFIGDRSGSAIVTVPPSVRITLLGRGVQEVIYLYETRVSENWVELMWPYFQE